MTESASTPNMPKNWAVRFFTIWTGQAFSMFGSSLVQFALVWWLTKQTGSATILATASLAAMLPQIIIGPIAGAYVDRNNRRIIMIISDGIAALAIVALAILFATANIEVWHIYVAMTIRSICGAFQWPAMSASTSLMVPKDQLTRVGGLNQTLQGLMGLVAPPTGALLISILPTQGVLMIDVATAILAILPLFFFTIPQPERRETAKTEEKTSVLQDMREGFAFMLSWPGLMAVLVMATIINCVLTPMGALMPLLVTKYFGLGALELGFTDTAWGAGIIAGGVLLGIWGGFKRKIFTSMMGICGLGAGVLLVGFAPPNMFWMALAGMGLVGAMNAMANGPLHAILQSVVPNDKQGRVMSLIGAVGTAMSPISLMLAGPVSDAFGIRTWYWLGGFLTLAMGIVGLMIPAVVNLENNHHQDTKIESAPVPLPATD